MAPLPMSPADTDSDIVAFYNRDLIDLAAQAGDEVALDGATHRGMARSPICGSVVDVALTLDTQNRVTAFGYKLEACALTKSVVAVMKRAIVGATRSEIGQAHTALGLLLEGDAEGASALWPNERWAQMMILAPLKDHQVRHNAMQLPFEAAEKAFDNRAI